MTAPRMNLNNILLMVVGVLLLFVWVSFIDRAVRHPVPFIVAGLAIILMITRNWSNLVFHMVGVLMFGFALAYIQNLTQYPLRFAVIALAIILLTTRNIRNEKTPYSYTLHKLREKRKENERRKNEQK